MIRYAFLWSHEARQGACEGRKDRPAAIVVATRKDEQGDIRVIVAPITHEPPKDVHASIEIPAKDAAALGLDGERHWIRLDELNRFAWPGFDLRPIPAKPTSYDYGMMPESLYTRMKTGILERQRARSTKILDRD